MIIWGIYPIGLLEDLCTLKKSLLLCISHWPQGISPMVMWVLTPLKLLSLPFLTLLRCTHWTPWMSCTTSGDHRDYTWWLLSCYALLPCLLRIHLSESHWLHPPCESSAGMTIASSSTRCHYFKGPCCPWSMVELGRPSSFCFLSTEWSCISTAYAPRP